MFALTPRFAEHAEQLNRAVRHHCTKAQTKLDQVMQHSDVHPRIILYAGLALVTCVWLAITVTHRIRPRKRQSITPPSTPNLEKRSPFKAPDRPPGGTTYFLF